MSCKWKSHVRLKSKSSRTHHSLIMTLHVWLQPPILPAWSWRIWISVWYGLQSVTKIYFSPRLKLHQWEQLTCNLHALFKREQFYWIWVHSLLSSLGEHRTFVSLTFSAGKVNVRSSWVLIYIGFLLIFSNGCMNSSWTCASESGHPPASTTEQ